MNEISNGDRNHYKRAYLRAVYVESLKLLKMKKRILFLFTLISFHAVYSQTEKGKMFIGGNVNLTGNSNSNLDTSYQSDFSTTTFIFAPNIGYFVADNFAIGANINLGASSLVQNNENKSTTASLPSKFTNKTTTLSYGLGGFARYYIDISEKLKFFIKGGINYSYSIHNRKDSNNDPNDVNNANSSPYMDAQTNSISLLCNPGFVYFIGPKLGIETNFGNISYAYSSSTNKSLPYDNKITSHNYSLNVNPSSFCLGLNYYF